MQQKLLFLYILVKFRHEWNNRPLKIFCATHIDIELTYRVCYAKTQFTLFGSPSS